MVQEKPSKYYDRGAVKGEYPDFEIDYEKFRFSEGDLEGTENLQLTRFDDRVEFTWDSLLKDNGGNDDQAMILLVSKDKNIALGEFSGAQRKEGKQIVFLESSEIQDIRFESYFAFISDDRSMVSTSVYCGQV